jgi:hypothetical protein
MMKKKTQIGPRDKGYTSGLNLSLEAKCAEELLQESCHWAVNLAEGIAGFDFWFSDAVNCLDQLRKIPLEAGFDPRAAPKIRSVLNKLRKYCRKMASEDEPLSIDGIIEDLQQLKRHSLKLNRLIKAAES